MINLIATANHRWKLGDVSRITVSLMDAIDNSGFGPTILIGKPDGQDSISVNGPEQLQQLIDALQEAATKIWDFDPDPDRAADTNEAHAANLLDAPPKT